MGDIQHETAVRDRLIAPSDAQPLPSTTVFDDHQEASTEMKLPMYVDPPNAPPRPANFLKKIFKLNKYLKIMICSVFAVVLLFSVGVYVYQMKRMQTHESDQPYIKEQQPKSENIMNRPKQSANCVVPAHPEHGEYIISDAPTAKPGESFESLKLTVNCLPGYITQNAYTHSGYLVSRTDPIFCETGTWSHTLPTCVRSCKLDNNTSVLYHCLVNDIITGSYPCNAYEPSGTVVSPECRRPNNLVTTLPNMTCINGSWDHVPDCSRAFCKLDNNTSVLYHCLDKGSIDGRRTCNAYEPSGTVVLPECRPNYAFNTLPSMTCINGSWDHIPDCSQECGRVTSNSEALMTDSSPAKHGELPWHVGVYRKSKENCPWPCSWLCPFLCPYEQFCSGSLVSNSVVISAAQCFWKDVTKKQPASLFAVAAGKIYRGRNDPTDVHAQKSNVKEINIPPLFQGGIANFQDDIAVVILETPFEYTLFVGRVCLSFNYDFETSQLQPGRLGKVAGWGLTAENGKSSRSLMVVELPYVDNTECMEASPENYKASITDKNICAGYGNGTAATCKGDSGGGLVFPYEGHQYLRGIVSAAPISKEECNIYALGIDLDATTNVGSTQFKYLHEIPLKPKKKFKPKICQGCNKSFSSVGMTFKIQKLT